MLVLSSLIHLLGVSILSFITSRRLGNGPLRNSPWPRLCTLIVFVDSYLFLLTAGVLALGVGMEHNRLTCAWGIYLCIIFYLSSKVFIYLFLAERVRIVWHSHAKRSQSRIYIICLSVGLIIYTGLLVLSLVDGEMSTFEGGVCKIGVKTTSTITVLSFEIFIDIFLTALFVWPLLRMDSQQSLVRRLGIRSIWATSVGMASLCVNLTILIVSRGSEIGWVCLGWCSADIVVNAVVLFLVTDPLSDEPGSSGPCTTPRFASFPLTKNEGELTGIFTTPSAPTSGSAMDDRSKRRDIYPPDSEASKIGVKEVFAGRQRTSISRDEEHGAIKVQITKEFTVTKSSIGDADSGLS